MIHLRAHARLGVGALLGLLLAWTPLLRDAAAQGPASLRPVVRFEPESPRAGGAVTITVQFFRPMRTVTGQIRGVEEPLEFELNALRRVATARVTLPSGLRNGDYAVDLEVRDVANRLERVRSTLTVGAPRNTGTVTETGDLTVRLEPETARPASVIRVTVTTNRRVRGLPTGIVDGGEQALLFERDESVKTGGRFTARYRIPDSTQNGSYRVTVEAREAEGDVLKGRATLKVDRNAALGTIPVTGGAAAAGLIVAVSPDVARPGDRVTITARADRGSLRRAPEGSVAGSLVALEFQSEGTGRYVSRFRIPEDARNGSYKIQVEGSSSTGNEVRGEATLRVDRNALVGNGDRQWSFTISVEPEIVRPGERVTITARSNRPLRDAPQGRFTNAPVSFDFQPVEGSNQLYRARFTVPDNTRGGSYRLEVEGTDREGAESKPSATLRVDRDGGAGAAQGRLRITVTPEVLRTGERMRVTIVSDRPLRRAPRLTATNGLPVPELGGDDDRNFVGGVRLPANLAAGTYRIEAQGRDEEGKTYTGSVTVTVRR